ncbi:MAG: flagellar motor switch protein FliG [Thermodesulfobacteriota bacterium]|nr:flagellar motor switch protein FliG [Thermodesulfobacteriota bacterium]
MTKGKDRASVIRGRERISGLDKAAILLLYLGEEITSGILRNLNEEELHIVSKQMTELRGIEPEIVDDVIDEYIELVSSSSMINPGGEEYVQKVLFKAVGEEKANSIMRLLSMGMFDGGLKSYDEQSIVESIRRMDSESVANMIRGEHPQTIALILAHLKPDQVSQVIPLLPEQFQAEVVMRIATLDRVSPDALDEIQDVLRAQLKRFGTSGKRSVGGMDSVAEVMNTVDKATGKSIMVKVEEIDPYLAEDIKKLMFVFEDLVRIDSRGIQAILKEVSNEDITLALKVANEDVKEHILKNVSERAAAMIREDLEALGPVRLSDVEQVQQSIIAIARRLEDEGRIFIGGKGGETIVE